MGSNLDKKTVEGFGDEWGRFDQSELDNEERQQLFEMYFAVFPWDELPKNAVGFDLGCGSGRWAKMVADKVGTLHCIDASDEALNVARKNLSESTNVEFHNASVDDIPLGEATMDFGYSLGVLHHVPDTEMAMTSCVSKLKPGSPFLVYLYYAFDNRPGWFRALWRLSDFFRRIVSKLPFVIRRTVCDLIAACVYFPLAMVSRLAERLKVGVDRIPLSIYRHRSFYTMRTDALDRFGTGLEQRFTKSEILQLMQNAGLDNIEFSVGEPYWCAVGRRKALVE